MIDLTGYRLTFDEEFNKRSISQTGTGTTWADIRSQWRFDANSDIGFGHSSFVDAASGYDPFSVRNGALTITAVPDQTKFGYPGSWESGLITTQGNFSQTYGYFEMRANLSSSIGAWDAFWLLPNQAASNPNHLPGWQELDVVEHYGSNEGGVYSALHTTDSTPSQNLQYYSSHPGLTSGYHTYGIDWQADKISFYFDGKYMGYQLTPSDMHGPMYILANLATQGSGGNNADAAGKPMSMSIDYIRAYSNDPNAVGVVHDTVSAPDNADPGLYGATSAAVASSSIVVPLNSTAPTAASDSTTLVVTKPATGITATLAHDTGSSSTDGITADATVSGVTDAGATVTLADETNHVVGSAIADANGHYSITPAGLSDGTHTLAATEVYLGANANTACVNLTFDQTATGVPAVALAHDTGVSAIDRITSDASLTVRPAEPGGSLGYVVDGKVVAAYDPSTLKDGAHTVSVTQTDAAGNASAAGSLDFTLDHAPPSLGADAASGTGVAAALTGHLLANDADAAALHVVSVQYANGLSKAVSTDGGVQVNAANGTMTVAADGSYSFRATDPGRAVFTETVADAAGNTSQTTLTLDVAKAVISASLSFGFALTEGRFDFSHGHDLMTAPDGTVTDLTGVATIAFTDGTVQEKDGAALVDDLYYDAHNLDVWRAHVDPAAHYAANGWHEGRDPNAYFSTSGYLAANPDVAAAGVNPLTHYDQYGWHEGRSPGANFSAEAYLAVNPDVAKAGIDPLAHYLEYGQAEGRAAQPGLTVARGSGDHLYGDFDATYYLAHNSDVAAAARVQGGPADSFAFTHYLTFGAHEGRDPDALFSTNGYLAANPNVAASGVNPLLHYEQEGWFQGRDPSASFHTDAYLTANPDVAAASVDPLLHYLQFGQAEGRHLA